MGVLDKLKSRMNGPGKTPFGRPTEPVSEQVNNSSLLSKENIKTAKTISKFATKQGVKQALKAFGQKAVSTAFGVGGMLLSSQKAYAGPGDDYWRKKELEKQGYTPLTQKDINNMPQTSSGANESSSEFDEYYKDGIPEVTE